MVKDYKGDPASVLLDILDKAQNTMFVDNYLEEPFDLSNILFVLTANNIYDIPLELRDRLEIIELTSYTVFEKIEIAKKYLLPDIYKEHNLNTKNIKFSDNILKEIIENYTNEAGVRELNRVLTNIMRKLIVLDKISGTKIDSKNLVELLGPAKYVNDLIIKEEITGLVNALAVSNIGGIVMPIESIFYEGNGKINITGSLENVMNESVKVALSYVKTNKDKYQINDYYFNNKDLHIHCLDGATKKDGPSAGVTITSSIISSMINKKVPYNVAMTGEITLNGFIKKVGGIKEKIIGAYKEGIKKIFIPRENHIDLLNIPKEILDRIEIIEVNHYDEIFNILFK
jgi:ATP-dependent Lon protease